MTLNFSNGFSLDLPGGNNEPFSGIAPSNSTELPCAATSCHGLFTPRARTRRAAGASRHSISRILNTATPKPHSLSPRKAAGCRASRQPMQWATPGENTPCQSARRHVPLELPHHHRKILEKEWPGLAMQLEVDSRTRRSIGSSRTRHGNSAAQPKAACSSSRTSPPSTWSKRLRGTARSPRLKNSSRKPRTHGVETIPWICCRVPRSRDMRLPGQG